MQVAGEGAMEEWDGGKEERQWGGGGGVSKQIRNESEVNDWNDEMLIN